MLVRPPRIASLLILLSATWLAPAMAARADDDVEAMKPKKAIKQYSRAVEKAPDDPDNWYNLGVAYILAEEWNPASEALARCVELSPENARAHFRLGEAHEGAGRSEEATAAFRRAGELDETMLAAHVRLGGLALDAGRTDEAIEAFKNALRAKPEDPTPIYSSLGGAYLAAGDTDQALKWLERTLEKNPDDPAANFNLAATLRKAGRDQKDAALTRRAAELFIKAAEGDPSDAQAQFLAAETLLWINDTDRAKVYIERYLELDPEGRRLGSDLHGAAREYHQMLGG